MNDPKSLMMWGEMASHSGLAKNMNAYQAGMIIQAGSELGYGPAASLNCFYIVGHKVTPLGQTMAAMIKKSGKYTYKVLSSTDEVAEITFMEKDGDNFQELGTVSFGKKDAAMAGLGGDAWRKYPSNMFFWRCLSKGARMFCADAMMGMIYTPEELADQLPQGVEVSINEDTGDQVIVDSRDNVVPPAPQIPETASVDFSQQDSHMGSMSQPSYPSNNANKQGEMLAQNTDQDDPNYGEDVFQWGKHKGKSASEIEASIEHRSYFTGFLKKELMKNNLAPYTAGVAKAAIERIEG
jgi:hypothetical protein